MIDDELVAQSLGKEIRVMRKDGDELTVLFTDGTGLRLSDEGQSCCEHRYMVVDDDLGEYAGAKFLGIDEKFFNRESEEWNEHETVFVEVLTSKGPLSVVNHNEHNGYYGGFYLCVKAAR